MFSTLPHPSIFAALAFALICCVPVIVWWRQMEFGQRIYAIGFATLLTCLPMLGIFWNPTNGDYQLAFAWDPPRYVDEEMTQFITPELVDEVQHKHGIQFSPDFVENSTTREMNQLSWRYYLLPIMALGAVAWFVVPPLIDRIVFRAGRVKSQLNATKKNWHVGDWE